jgi:hypothetical protein
MNLLPMAWLARIARCRLIPIKASRQIACYNKKHCERRSKFLPRKTFAFRRHGQAKMVEVPRNKDAGNRSGSRPDLRNISSVAGARPRWAVAAAVVAVLFGVLTVFSGGTALFGGREARAAVGEAVPFVLWFNFTSGFAYVVAGVGLFLWRRWAAILSAGIAIAALLIFAAFGLYVVNGGAFEMRTVGAMVLRTGTWTAIAVASCRALGCSKSKSAR